jgi:magnesium transporter
MTPPNASPNGTAVSGDLLYLLHADPVELGDMLGSMRAADVVDALNQLELDAAAKVLGVIPFDLAVQAFDEPELSRKTDLVQRLDTATATQLIDAMSADQQADLFRELPDAQRSRFFRGLPESTRQTLSTLLAYPPDSAGGIMTTEFVAVPVPWNVEQILAHLTQVGGAKETVYAVYVVDSADGRLIHVVSLRELLIADRSAAVTSIGEGRQIVSVQPLADREEVARLISKYDLLAVPVLDEAGRMLGIVTVDDVIDAIVAEQTEDVQKFGGVEAFDEPYMSVGFLTMVRKRAGWLMALFVGEMLTATALAGFQQEIERAVVLALFIPLIISSGGNSGGQSTSLIIRAMALREVRLRDWWRVARRDLPAGLTLGSILGLIALLRILVWQGLGWYDYGVHHLLVAATVGLSVIGVVTFGSFTGAMLPFLIRRIGLDPATASAPFVATLVDVTGLVIYFSIAALILHGTLL